MTVAYRGQRNIQSETGKIDMQRGICSVYKGNGKPLNSVFIDGNQFPEKIFEWGYFGMYPMNLAKSILVDYFEKDSSDIFFNKLVRTFCYEVIANLPFRNWEIEEEQLKPYLTRTVTEVYGDEIYEN